MSIKSFESKSSRSSEEYSVGSSITILGGGGNEEGESKTEDEYKSDYGDFESDNDVLNIDKSEKCDQYDKVGQKEINNVKSKIDLFLPRCEANVIDTNNEIISPESDLREEIELSDRENSDDTGLKSLIKDHEKLAKKHVAEKNGDGAIEEYVRCLTLSMGVGEWSGDGGVEGWIEGAVYHSRLAKVYLELKDYPQQSLDHCHASQSIIDSVEKEFTNLSIIQSVNRNEDDNDSINRDSKDKIDTTSNGKESIKRDLHKFQAFKSSSSYQCLLLDLLYITTHSYLSLKKLKKAETCLLRYQQLISCICGGVGGELVPQNNKERREIALADEFRGMQLEELFVKLYEAMGKTDLALDHLDKRINMGGSDDDPLKMVSLYHTMGRLQQSRGAAEINTERALECYMKAHGIVLTLYGETSIEGADSSFKIALKLASSADDVTEGYLKDSIEVYKRTLGMNNVSTLCAIDEMAKLVMRRGDIESALHLLKGSFRHKKLHFPHFSTNLSTHLKTVATCHLALNQHQQALTNFQKCLLIEKVIYPHKHKETLITQRNIKMLQNRNSKDTRCRKGF